MEQKEDVFIELHEKLVNDNSGVVKKEVEDYLMEWRTKVKRQMDSGLPPEEFSRFQTIEDAISRAIGVLGRSWSLFHG